MRMSLPLPSCVVLCWHDWGLSTSKLVISFYPPPTRSRIYQLKMCLFYKIYVEEKGEKSLHANPPLVVNKNLGFCISLSHTHARIAYSAASQFCSAFSLTTTRDFPRTCSEKNDSFFFKKYNRNCVLPGPVCLSWPRWQVSGRVILTKKVAQPLLSLEKKACTGSRFF